MLRRLLSTHRSKDDSLLHSSSTSSSSDSSSIRATATRRRTPLLIAAVIVSMVLLFNLIADPLLVLNKLDRQRSMRRVAREDDASVRWCAVFTAAVRETMAAARMLEGFVQSTLSDTPLPASPPSPSSSSADSRRVEDSDAALHGSDVYARFPQVASLIAHTVPSLAAQLIAPDGVVRYAWPYDATLLNRSMFNTSDPMFDRRPLPIETMTSGNVSIVSPHHLPTTVLRDAWLVTVRMPVFYVNDMAQHSADNFRGFTSTLLNLSDVIAQHNMVASLDAEGMDFLLYSYDATNGSFLVIAASPWLRNASLDTQLTFVRTAVPGTPIFSGVNLSLAVRMQNLTPMLNANNIACIVAPGVLLALLVLLALIAVIERCTRTYDGRLYAPKLTPFALLTVGPCYGEELWNLVPVQMAEVMDRLNRVLNRQMAAHRAYKVAQMQPYTTVFVLRTVEAAVHMSFDVITELQRHPIDADLATLLDEDGQLLMAYAVHLCTDVAIVPSVIGDRGYRYEGADMVYGARMWAFAAPNTVTLSAAAQPHACAMRRQRRGRRRGSSGRKAGGHNSSSGNNNDKTSHNSTSACSNASSALHNSSSSGNSSSNSSGNHHSDIVVSAYNTIFLRGVQGKQELYTVTDTTNKWLAQASAIAHARVQRELGAQEQLAQQQHRVRARVRVQGSDGSYNSAVTSSMYYVSSSTTTPCSSSLPAHHLLRSSSSSASSRHDLDASANDRESMATSQSDGTRESQQQQQQQQQHAGVVLPARRAASVTVPPSGLLLAPASYLHDHVSSSSGSNSSGETNHSGGNSRAAATTTTTAAMTTMATTVAVSPARALLPHLLTHADGGGASATRAHGDNPLATDTTNDAHTPSAPVTTRDGNRGGSGNLVGGVVAAAVRTTSVAAVVSSSSSSSSNAKRNSGGGAGATGGPLRVDVPVNPLVVTAAAPLSSTTPTRALTSNAALVQQQQQQQLANTTWKSPSHGSVAAAAAGIDVARSDGATTTTAMHAATSAAVVASATAASMVVNNSVHSAVGNNCSAGGGGGGGVMHAVHHSLAGGRTSASLDATDNPLELGHALHQPTLSSLSGVVVLSEHSDEQRAHEHAGHVQQQQQQQQLHLLQQEQPVSLTTVSSNTLLSGFGPLQCTAPVATATMTTAAVATTAAANNATATTTTTTTAAVTPEYGLQEANTCAWLHRAIPLWLDKALRRAFDHQSIALAISYESVRVMVYYFYASYKLLFRPLAVPERDNIYRRLITAFGIPRKDILEHLAARCTIHYMQQHEHTKSLAWKTYARAEA